MKTTFDFLQKLKKNNNRDWFEKHRGEFLEAKTEFEAFCEVVLSGIKKFDKEIPGDEHAADCIFRIYRDVRFSKDKTPYKSHFGASINPGGRKSITAGYYLHIKPGECFVAGGVWQPPSPMLQAIRQEIDYNPEPLLKLMKSTSFKKYYKAFDNEDQLKTIPKGFDKDHPHIDILRNKSFIVSHSFGDKAILSEKGAGELIAAFKAMFPLLQYLRVAQHTS